MRWDPLNLNAHHKQATEGSAADRVKSQPRGPQKSLWAPENADRRYGGHDLCTGDPVAAKRTENHRRHTRHGRTEHPAGQGGDFSRVRAGGATFRAGLTRRSHLVYIIHVSIQNIP